MGQELVIDMADISRLDTAGAMALQRTMFDCAQRAGRLTQLDHYKGGSIEHMALIDQAAKHLESCQVGPKRGNAFIIMLNRIGLGTSNVRKQSLSVLGFVGAVMERIGVIVTHPKRLRTTSIVFHMEESGPQRLADCRVDVVPDRRGGGVYGGRRCCANSGRRFIPLN